MEMSPTLYSIALVTHVVGITIMAGTSFIDFITFRVFLNTFIADRTKGLVLEGYLNKLQRFLGIGMAVILLSGITMMVKLHELWGAQTWFRIKMVILLLIIINGLGIRRVIGTRLKRLLNQDDADDFSNQKFDRIKRNLITVQLIQLLLFIIIYVLSIFKFN